MIRDNIMLYNEYDQLHTKCYACGKTNHLYSTCPTVNFTTINEDLLGKSAYSVS